MPFYIDATEHIQTISFRLLFYCDANSLINMTSPLNKLGIIMMTSYKLHSETIMIDKLLNLCSF